MAYEEALDTRTLEAAGDLSTKQHHFVKIDSNGRVTTTTATSDRVYGVQRNKPSAVGHATTVIRGGVAKVVAGAAVAKGAQVMSSAAGRAITATTGLPVAGRALTAAAANGEVIAVELALQGEPNAA